MEAYIVMVGTLPLMLAVIGFGVWVWTHVIITQKKANEYKPDFNGNYPVIRNGNQFHQFAPGNIPQLSSVTHYAPHTITHIKPSNAAPVIDVPIDAPALPAPALQVPDFGQLLSDGTIKPNNFLLGWSEDGGLFGSWLDLYSLSIGGYQGSGKTNSAVFYAAQAALSGCKLAICDKHAGHPESLTNALEGLESAFYCQPASSANAIAKLVNTIRNEVEARIEAGKSGQPILLIMEELPALIATEIGEKIAALLVRINDEGRKYGVYVLGVAQRWKAATVGNTDVRSSFASTLVHRMKRDEARHLLQEPDAARSVPTFQKGEGWLYSTSGQLSKVQIPLITSSHIDRVATIIEGEKPVVVSPLKVVSKSFESPLESPETPLQKDNLLSAEDAAVLAEFKRGKSLREIAQTISGATAGNKYNKTLDEVTEALRRALP